MAGIRQNQAKNSASRVVGLVERRLKSFRDFSEAFDEKSVGLHQGDLYESLNTDFGVQMVGTGSVARSILWEAVSERSREGRREGQRLVNYSNPLALFWPLLGPS
jgi:hypothetical protein